MWPNPQFPADLVTFTEEIFNGKLHFLCSKFWRRGESSRSLKISVFPSDKALCVAAALDCYIEKTSIRREKNEASQLLVSFIKPRNAVAKSAFAG